MDPQFFDIFLDGIFLTTNLTLELDNVLSDLRNSLSDQTENDFFFIDQNNKKIEKNDEQNIKIEKILKDNKVNIRSVGNTINGSSINNKQYTFIVNNKTLKMELNSNFSLDYIRFLINEKITDNIDFVFILNGKIIPKFNEGEIKLNSFDDVIVTKIVEEKEQNNEKTKIRYKFKIDGSIYYRNYFYTDKLNIVREDLGNLINLNYRFFNEKEEKINLKEEDKINISDLIKFINTPIKIIKVKNEPIKKSIKLTKKKGIKQLYLYPEIKYSIEDEAEALTIMVVGQTGSGKTTLLNSLINYLMGIKYEDDFRYVIINEFTGKNQSQSQTSDVNIYRIQKTDYFPPITIVDTPGFGDTRGIDYDRIITDKIGEIFKNKIDNINAICFVVQSYNVRLTSSQKYIFSSIMNLFGDDIAENFIAMLTFCDEGTPTILQSLSEKGSGFDLVKDKIKGDWYFKFNNSAIFIENERESNIESSWDKAMKNYENFMNKLISLPQKSLTKSKEVLNERKEITVKIENLKLELENGLSKLNSVKEVLKDIKLAKKEINDSKNYVKIIEVPKVEKIQLPVGKYTTTCLKCNRTCHKFCAYSSNEDKIKCCAMRKEYCIICEGKCHYKLHENTPYYYEYSTVKETITLEKLKELYCTSKSNLSNYEQIKNGLENEVKIQFNNCLKLQEEVKKHIDKLKKIALNKSSFESSEDYINEIIITEKQEHKPGWEARVSGYEELKKKHKMIRDAYNGQQIINQDFEEFKKKYIMDENENIPNTKIDKDKTCSIF